jgi:ATP-binding cassette subfamily B protein
MAVSELSKQSSGFSIQRKFIKEILPYWYLFVTSISLMLFGTFVTLLQPEIIKRLIDEVFSKQESSRLVFYSISIVGIAILSGVISFVSRYLNAKGSQKTIFDLRNKMFTKIQQQSMRFFDVNETGQLMARTTGDVDVIRQYLSFGLRTGISSIFSIIGIAIAIWIIHPSLFPVFLILLPFVLAISVFYAKKASPLFRSRREFYGRLSNTIQENIAATDIVRSFVQEEREQQSFDRLNREYLDLQIRTAKIRGFTMPLNGLIVSIGSIAILWFGGTQIITQPNNANNLLTMGELIQFNLYILSLRMPIHMLGMFLATYQRSIASGERVYELLDSEIELFEEPNAVNPGIIQGEIHFKDITFEYEPGHPVLQDINLKIEKGQTIAILGATGSGKSSFIQLIPRFYDPIKGEVIIDKTNVKNMQLRSLRKQIGIVSQETFLFSSSILDNIKFGNPDATLEEVKAAAKAARAHDFIMNFPDGYDTVVGERGITLSGGQQQRVSIARTILIDPRILILDDSTSSVDAQTEAEIQEAFALILKDRTSIIITQRVSSLRHASYIVVLEYGSIVEEGSHEELIERNGLYAAIYQTQEDPEIQLEVAAITGGD